MIVKDKKNPFDLRLIASIVIVLSGIAIWLLVVESFAAFPILPLLFVLGPVLFLLFFVSLVTCILLFMVNVIEYIPEGMNVAYINMHAVFFIFYIYLKEGQLIG